MLLSYTGGLGIHTNSKLGGGSKSTKNKITKLIYA